MANEIERKYLIREESWKKENKASGLPIRQGYLSTVKERMVRVRIAGDKAFLTVKGITVGATRNEFEYSIPVKEDGVEGQPTFRESLDASLSALLSFAATSHNGNNPESSAVVRRMLRDDMVLRWLEGLSPYRPAFGVLEKHLLVASNPQLISNFPKTSVAISLASEPLFATVRSRHFEDHSQWLFLNASATRRFVEEYHEPLSGQLAYWRKIEASSAGQHLDRLAEMLTPFDTAFSATKISAGEVRWTVGLVTPTP